MTSHTPLDSPAARRAWWRFGVDLAAEMLELRKLSRRELRSVARWQARCARERGDLRSRVEWLAAGRVAGPLNTTGWTV